MEAFTNYHSHTTRCMHATGTEEGYVLRAIETGFSLLGFADHSPWPYKSSFVSNIRMKLNELDGYIREVERLKQKYASQIELHLGLECEAFPEFYGWLRELRAAGHIEYLLLGNHYDTNDEYGTYFGRCPDAATAYRYMETTVAGMESGLFCCLAHPDLFLHGYATFDADAKRVCRELCACAKRLNLPLEYNMLGARRNAVDRSRGFVGYTSREFWEIAAETRNRVIIGVDAHAEEQLDCADAYREARDRLSGMGLEVIDRLF